MPLKNLVLSCVLLTSFAAPDYSFAQQQKKSYEISAFSNFKSLPANTTAQAKTIKTAHSQFPGWTVTTDKLSGIFTDIYGAPVLFSGSNNRERSQVCITTKIKTLGVTKSEWKQVSAPSAPKADYVNYRQAIDGHDVVFSWLSFRFTKTGELARIQMRNFGTVAKTTTPEITPEDAKKIAVTDLDGVSTVSGATIGADWSWFPIPSAKGYDLHPAWHFKVTGKIPGGIPLILTGYIDAITGKMLYRTNEVKETGYDLTVKGMVYKNGTLNPATLEPLENIDLTIGASTYLTDTGGHYTNASLLLPLSTSIPLAGKWAVVLDSMTGTVPVFANLVSLPGTTYTYPVTTPSSNRHVNAYYHVNRVHDFMKSYFTTFTGMDTSLLTNVDLVGGTCNAFYTGHDINFFAASSACHSFAEMGDVVYHEYGHGISDHFYSYITGGISIMNGALNEANSDIWALSITRDPVLAQNAYVTYGGFIRRYDLMPQVYPIDLQGFDSHKDGQIIAGTWWDVGQNIGSIDSMTKLFTDVYYDVPDGPLGSEGYVYQTILIDALFADDNNSNIHDGTPHYAQIVAAFAKHGIYLEGDALISHTEPNRPKDGAAIPISAYLSLGTTDFMHDLTMYYRINSTGTWNPVVLANSGTLFTGSVPAQTVGTTVEYFFTIHDSLGQPNAFFPTTCNPALGAKQVTLPYQFGVGIKSVDSLDFESFPSGWGIGGNPGDDASDGLWRLGPPGSSSSFLTAWPSGDHTTGSGNCLITGDGNIGFMGTGVTNGTATILSPVFDLTGYTTPIIEYYRWFSNEQNFENFKDDPWIVKIRDASGSTWSTVEYTYQSEISWRRRIFPVHAFVPSTATQVQLKFFASDSIRSTWGRNGRSTVVGGIDDFFIYDKASPSGVATVSPVKAEIFPNPADDRINIHLQNNAGGIISLWDIEGKKVTTIPMTQNNNNYTINTNNLATGTYNLVIQSDKTIQSKKIIIRHQ